MGPVSWIAKIQYQCCPFGWLWAPNVWILFKNILAGWGCEYWKANKVAVQRKGSFIYLHSQILKSRGKMKPIHQDVYVLVKRFPKTQRTSCGRVLFLFLFRAFLRRCRSPSCNLAHFIAHWITRWLVLGSSPDIFLSERQDNRKGNPESLHQLKHHRDSTPQRFSNEFSLENAKMFAMSILVWVFKRHARASVTTKRV